MAELRRLRARKPLAVGRLHPDAWSCMRLEGERFILSLDSYSLKLSRAEAQALVDRLSVRLRDPDLMAQANRNGRG